MGRGVAQACEGRSFNVGLLGVALRVTCGSFRAAYEVSPRFPQPSARGRSRAAGSGRCARFCSRPRWPRPKNGHPLSVPDFCRKYDLTRPELGGPPPPARFRRWPGRSQDRPKASSILFFVLPRNSRRNCSLPPLRTYKAPSIACWAMRVSYVWQDCYAAGEKNF
jgi:hypothetical protein